MSVSRIRHSLLCFGITTLLLTGCNDDPQPQQYVQSVQPSAGQATNVPATNQQQPQVIYQQQPQQEDHTIRDGLIGAGVGYMLGRHTAGNNNGGGGFGGGYHAPPTVVHNTVVKKVYVQQNVIRSSPRFPTPRPAVFKRGKR